MKKTKKTLGILGGMGPMATVRFYELLTERTLAEKDSDHLRIVITSNAEIPDRTDFILGKSKNSPLPMMCSDAKKLRDAGSEIIAIPCNTAQYFHNELAETVDIPVLNIVEITANHVSSRGFKRAGILATDGTVKIGSYKNALAARGVECIAPPAHIQALVTSVIYDYVKAGKPGGEDIFAKISDYMFSHGCDCLILGCTELPLAAPKNDSRLVDSLETLAYESIIACGCNPIGFSDEFLSAYKKSSTETEYAFT